MTALTPLSGIILYYRPVAAYCWRSGIDSVAMATLFHRAGLGFDIAHCNFQLRGQESDEDQAFVENLAVQYKSRLFIRKFPTREFCRNKGISVQMGARELRYNWFEELATAEGYDTIALAHNKNDLAETMLINLIRGTGLKGLTGIKPASGRIIRPMLFASREEIEDFVGQEDLAYREDSSNRDTKYHRNLIRLKIIPLMQKINPSLIETLYSESEIFNTAYQVYRNEVERIRKAVSEEYPDSIRFSISRIKALRLNPSVLYDLLAPYGFTFSDTKDIFRSLQGGSGKKFLSGDHVLIRDRNYLVIEKLIPEIVKKDYIIEEGIRKLHKPIHIVFTRTEYHAAFKIPKEKFRIALDYERLNFPLVLRHWKKGDYFIPLGMKGKKKLSDFFSDQKINLLEKKKIWLLLSGDQIVWIIGKQIHDHYKITPDTKSILLIEVKG